MLNKFNIEELGRKAVEIIRSKWGLPYSGFIAGGSIANLVWELVSGKKAIINDIDIFVLDGITDYVDCGFFSYKNKDIKYYENEYSQLNSLVFVKNFYTIIESEKNGIFNTIKYRSNNEDKSLIIKSFDINATMIGYSIDDDKLYWEKDFEDFLKTGELKVTNLMTPSHTAIRIVKKSKELNAKLDIFEIKLLQYAISYRFLDVIKLKFMERYSNMYKEYSEFLNKYFIIKDDIVTSEYLKLKFNKDVKIYGLKVIFDEIKIFDIDDYKTIFNDENIHSICISNRFLFYMRNIYNNEKLKKIWNKISYYADADYLDIDISSDDLNLLNKFFKYAPNSIENLRGYKLSEQLFIIKKFLNSFKEDPIIAISILENIKVDKDIELDYQNKLLLELSVRRKILNEEKAKKILDKENNYENNKQKSILSI